MDEGFCLSLRRSGEGDGGRFGWLAGYDKDGKNMAGWCLMDEGSCCGGRCEALNVKDEF